MPEELPKVILSQEIKNIHKKITAVYNAAHEFNILKNAIQKGDEDFVSAFKKTGTALVVTNENLEICMANEQVESLTGYLFEEINGKKWTDFLALEDGDLFIDYFKKCHDQLSISDPVNLNIVHKSGRLKNVSGNLVLIPGKNISIIALIDMTELKILEDALNKSAVSEWEIDIEEYRESRQRFKEIADLLPGIICEIDMDFMLSYVNQKGLNTFGFTQEEFEKGINILELIPPAAQQEFEKDVYNIFHGDFGNPVVYELFKKDRSIIHVMINSAPIFKNGAPAGVRTCIIDISDLVTAEEKLKISEERFRTIFAESPIGIALFSANGFIVEKNRSFEEMFNLVGGFENDSPLFYFLSIDENAMKTIHEGKGLIHESEHISKCEENETIIYFEWHITPIGFNGDSPVIYLAQVKDITEQKQAQAVRLKKAKEATERAHALIASLRKELREKSTFQNMVSRSAEMKKIFEILPEVAQAAASVLICGDSGTGKELVARSLHELSARKSKPFVAINCSALPDNLLESELFGYKAGAFTDAKKDKPGKFALAEGGTIFLDEIGDISMAMQVKLLRVLQERVYEPLGGTATVKANVRVIAATNKDLNSMVSKGSFREDLFYRINVVAIKLPNLNERRCDIPLLCEHFIDRYNFRYGKEIKEINKEAMEIILSYNFPGNIRELENIIEHAFIFCKNAVIEPHHLPLALRSAENTGKIKELSFINNLDELEKIYLQSVINECGGDKAKTAQKLGIHRATLFRKLKHYGLN